MPSNDTQEKIHNIEEKMHLYYIQEKIHNRGKIHLYYIEEKIHNIEEKMHLYSASV